MAWIKEVKPPHKCTMPVRFFGSFQPGSIWQCDVLAVFDEAIESLESDDSAA